MFPAISEINKIPRIWSGETSGIDKCQVINLLKQLRFCWRNLGCIFILIGCLFIDLKILLFKEILDPFPVSVFSFYRGNILVLEQHKDEKPFPKAESK